MNNELQQKMQILENYLKQAGRVLVAFSAGVDSTFLLKCAHDVLGSNAIAVTAVSHAFPVSELETAKAFCAENQIEQILIHTNELSIEGFEYNPENRCYICKRALFKQILQQAEALGIEHVLEGSNEDDKSDYRPGAQALKELGIESPLQAAGLTKQEIRSLSKEAGLLTWGKPSMACLYSRFVYGEQLTLQKLAMVEQAEKFLRDAGFRQVRVRVHGTLARIETDRTDLEKIFRSGMSDAISKKLKELGFSYVTLDLSGYRTGSMNEDLTKNPDFRHLS